jgi:tryptophan synthase alpha chain
MNRIATTFTHLRNQRQSALVGFVTAGDPDPETSEQIVLAMCSAGVDLLELGIPFSDPTADGPTIQRSSERALAKGMNVSRVLEFTGRIRAAAATPIVLFSYYNPLFRYGARKFYRDALEAGADGLLVVDLPPEEAAEFVDDWPGRELALIRLIAPTTPRDRSRRIAAAATGFIYLVSKTGVTGSAGLNPAEVAQSVARLRSVTSLPICVGFGISRPKDVAAIAAEADGVVVGSAFEQLIDDHRQSPNLPGTIGDRVRCFKQAAAGAAEGSPAAAPPMLGGEGRPAC